MDWSYASKWCSKFTNDDGDGLLFFCSFFIFQPWIYNFLEPKKNKNKKKQRKKLGERKKNKKNFKI